MASTILSARTPCKPWASPSSALSKPGGWPPPPLYYGESRSDSLMEANAADRQLTAGPMELPPENFTPAPQPFTASEQAFN